MLCKSEYTACKCCEVCWLEIASTQILEIYQKIGLTLRL